MGAIPVDGIDRELEHHEHQSVRMSVSQRARRRQEADFRSEERRQMRAHNEVEVMHGGVLWRRWGRPGRWVGSWERVQ